MSAEYVVVMIMTYDIESEMLNFIRENIEVYVENLDVFSIGNQCFAFNELSPDRRDAYSMSVKSDSISDDSHVVNVY